MNRVKGHIDYSLALVILCLILFGVVMIASIGVPKSIELTKDPSIIYPTCGVDGVDCYRLLKNHLGRVFLGFIAGIVALKIPTSWYRKLGVPVFIGIIVLLFTVLLFGSSYSTFATGWFVIHGTSLQPSELAKIGFIVYLARWLENKGKDLQDFKKGFVAFCIICGLVVGLLAAQPDFGSALVFSVIGVGMFFLAGAKTKHLMVGFVSVCIVGTLAVSSMEYLRHRFLSYLNPTETNCVVNDAGIARDYCWQTQQANIAVASGGFWGKGLTKGVQKAYWLPQASDDFIFAASAEELGFLRSAFVVFAFIFIGYRGLLIAKKAPDRYSMYIATGITLWITGQAFINIGVNTGVLPVTGITLPFISYGGTSMLANMFAAGMLLHISKYSNLSYGYTSSTNRRRNSGSHNAKSSPYRILEEPKSED